MPTPHETPSFAQLVELYGEQYLADFAGLYPCPACGGDGGGEAMPTGPHDVGRWPDCCHCGGTGSVGSEPDGGDLTDALAVSLRRIMEQSGRPYRQEYRDAELFQLHTRQWEDALAVLRAYDNQSK